MTINIVNHFESKDVAELNYGDVCFIRWGAETLLAVVARMPDGEKALARFAGAKEKAAMKLAFLPQLKQQDVLHVTEVDVRPEIDSIVPFHQGNNPIGALVITPQGLSVPVYPGDANRYYLSLADGSVSVDPSPPSPYYRQWSIIVPDGTPNGQLLKTVSV